MESPVELNSLLLKFFCYVTWFDDKLDPLQMSPIFQNLFFLSNNILVV